MALARVVSFDGVSQDRVDEMKRRMNEGRPDDVPATEIVMLYDAEAQKAIVTLFFDSEDDYNRRCDAERDARRRYAGPACIGREVRGRGSRNSVKEDFAESLPPR